MVLTLVNCSERKKPPSTSTATIAATGVVAVKAAQALSMHRGDQRVPGQRVAEPDRRRMRGTAHFIIMAPAAVESVIRPDWNGVMPKPICSSSGNRNGSAPAPTRKMKPPADPGAEGRQLEQRQVDHRRRNPPRWTT